MLSNSAKRFTCESSLLQKDDAMKTKNKSLIPRARPKKPSAAHASSVKSKQEYDRDFFKWTKTQSRLLGKGNLDDLDLDNLREEIESLGRNDKRSLRSHTVVLLTHLLKKKYQAEGQGNSESWNSSILNANMEIKYLIQDSPSLKNELKKIYSQAYEDAKEVAASDTKLSTKTFPKVCPWEIEEILPFLKKK